MRDCPMRVISCNSFTESSSRSNKAMMRNRVGSDNARRDFKVADIPPRLFSKKSVDEFKKTYIILS